MKKKEILSLSTLAMTAGLLIGACSAGMGTPPWDQNNPNANPNGNVGPNKPYEKQGNGPQGQYNDVNRPYTSQEYQSFYNALTPENQRKFNELDDMHKATAIQQFNMSKQGNRPLKQSGDFEGMEPAKNPNEAVEMQYKHQEQMMKGRGKPSDRYSTTSVTSPTIAQQ